MIIMNKLTSSLEERPVKTSPLPENGWDLKVEEASSLSTLYDYALKLERDGCVGKMSPQLYPAITVKTSPSSSLFSADGKSPFQSCSNTIAQSETACNIEKYGDPIGN